MQRENSKNFGSIREELIDGYRILKIKTRTEAEVLYVGHLKRRHSWLEKSSCRDREGKIEEDQEGKGKGVHLRGSYRGALWHASRTKIVTNHESRIASFHFSFLVT